MNKHFFELPKAVKRAVWAALMAEWAKKKAADLDALDIFNEIYSIPA